MDLANSALNMSYDNLFVTSPTSTTQSLVIPRTEQQYHRQESLNGFNQSFFCSPENFNTSYDSDSTPPITPANNLRGAFFAPAFGRVPNISELNLNQQIFQQRQFHQALYNLQLQQQAIALEQVIRKHQVVTAPAASEKPTNYVWSGNVALFSRNNRFLTYSTKVFVGGVPWDFNETMIAGIFKHFGNVSIEKPRTDVDAQLKGFAYVVFESEFRVKELLQECRVKTCPDENSSVNYFYKILTSNNKEKELEVIPWILNDSNFVKASNHKLDSSKTVFVGGLHGKITAHCLAKIMEDLFKGVIYVGIDTDKHKYPIGSARVTFDNCNSYLNAIDAAFITVRSKKFTKTLQIDPYLENTLCSSCRVQHGPYFCRNKLCLGYYCVLCWRIRHANDANFSTHLPLSRGMKNIQGR